jgi:lycopene beta-cyclase
LKVKLNTRVTTAFYRLVYKSKEPVQSRPSYFHGFFGGTKGNTRFMYVLPTSTTEALLEYTCFHDL